MGNTFCSNFELSPQLSVVEEVSNRDKEEKDKKDNAKSIVIEENLLTAKENVANLY